ncbi:YeiH family protein [Sphingosinithalassobacter portus]|uniref:YeiH family protein n=1 Tax=Stakelama portus TaxID=2676234 RepID=UPI000D6E1A4A|nr:putative sulfate exporter family transporter [Sphingosinithalassobacter portus]
MARALSVPIPSRFERPPLLPGIGLCLAVTLAGYAGAAVETALFGKPWLEPLVLAILIGAAVRSLWKPGPGWHRGIAFSAKTLLEIAVVLLGLSVSATTILRAGPALLGGIALTVMLALIAGYAIGRMLRLPQRMALLIACGNAICGNSAIAAVAPVIHADGDDVAAAIGFTAVLGVAVVLGLPLLGLALDLSAIGYGTLAGLTVYAVPQVLAAAAPFGTAAVHIGTLVKLVRVLMLGPVCVMLSLIAPRLDAVDEPADAIVAGDVQRPGLHQLVPWFILGFLALVGLRATGLVPETLVAPVGQVSGALTVVSMAALGLGVDVRSIAQAGPRVTAAVLLSLLLLLTIALALVALLAIA